MNDNHPPDDIRALFTGNDYLSAAEFADEHRTYKIRGIKGAQIESMDADKKGKYAGKPIVYFEGEERGWIISKTAMECIAGMFGYKISAWIGKRVTLHAELVQVGPKKEPGIRVTGSPDIDKAITVTIKLPKKRPEVVKLIPTDKPATQAKPPADPNTPSPQFTAAIEALGFKVADVLEWLAVTDRQLATVDRKGLVAELGTEAGSAGLRSFLAASGTEEM